ncbi:hypothetical protein ACHAXT_009862 [Thalassiosira profunda]
MSGAPPPPELDVADTGPVIGTLRPQVTAPPPPPPALVPDDAKLRDDKMDVDGPAGEEAADEGAALRLLDDLRGDDVPSRVAAARKLNIIASALGPERTRDELLPFLSDSVDDEDEVLEAMASSLGGLVSHVGGPSRAAALLKPLELLLAVEESAVRDRAAISAAAIGEQMSDADCQTDYCGMLSRLAGKEWFTARISACGLLPAAYSRATVDGRAAQREQFASLCKDDAPMVRRAAARNLGPFVKTVIGSDGPACLGEGGSAEGTLLELVEGLAGGDQPDSVRLHATQNCVCFGVALASVKESLAGEGEETLLRIDALVKRILPLVVATIDDRSWRVRWTAASRFADVVRAFSPLEGTMDALVPAYEKLLQDPEAEVRTAATFNLSEVAKSGAKVYPAGWSGADSDAGEGDEQQRVPVATRLAGRVASLTEDDSENVRAALASVATDLAPILGRDATIAQLLPPMLLLLRDSTGEVRLNVVSSLSSLGDVVGPELLAQSLLPAVLDLAEDGRWRIRLAVIKRMPLLAKQLGGEFFNDRLLALCVGWLGDDISSIREEAAANLKELTALLGSEWSVKNLLPRVHKVMEHPSYLRRTNAVRAASLMATAMDAEAAQWEVLPVLLEMHCDPVPNVRFNVAKGLGMVGPLLSKSVYEGQIVPILTVLGEDPDRDVRYFAEQSSDSLLDFFDDSMDTV